MTHVITNTPQETIRLGENIGSCLKKGDVLALTGELGSGKTTLVKGIAKGLGVSDIRYINSPTFVIVKEYKGRIPLYHFDIYRLKGPGALDEIGYEEYFYGEGAVVIEWAQKIRDILPKDHFNIKFEIIKRESRKIEFVPKGKKSNMLAERIKDRII